MGDAEMNLLSKLFHYLRHLDETQRYGRDLIYEWSQQPNVRRVLDIGCGNGEDLRNIGKAIPHAELHGIDMEIDIESQSLPYPDAHFDLVIINQVLEHCKEVYWIMGEISRVLKQGGTLIVGVPNLATWHDRLLLLIGKQPVEIKLPGPHVRGFTMGALKRFVELDGYFKVIDTAGRGFRPFPREIALALSVIFPDMATSLFLLCQRTAKSGNFIEILDSRGYETNYYKGEGLCLAKTA